MLIYALCNERILLTIRLGRTRLLNVHFTILILRLKFVLMSSYTQIGIQQMQKQQTIAKEILIKILSPAMSVTGVVIQCSFVGESLVQRCHCSSFFFNWCHIIPFKSTSKVPITTGVMFAKYPLGYAVRSYVLVLLLKYIHGVCSRKSGL